MGRNVFDEAEAHENDKNIRVDAEQIHELDIGADKRIAVYAHQNMTDEIDEGIPQMIAHEIPKQLNAHRRFPPAMAESKI
ncbi:hypothetical protein D3C75_989990 [compost metagenome]